MSMYSKEWLTYAIGQNDFAQLFIDNGCGFDEENSISWKYNEDYRISKKIVLEGGNILRFDPCNKPCVCYIYDI